MPPSENCLLERSIEQWVRRLSELVPTCLRTPELPEKEDTYSAIIEYLKKLYRVEVRYHTIVLLCGVSGFLFSLVLLVILYCHYGSLIFSLFSFYPSFIGTAIVSAFNAIEIENKKSRLYSLLKEKTARGASEIEDVFEIFALYKGIAWDEYKNRIL